VTRQEITSSAIPDPGSAREAEHISPLVSVITPTYNHEEFIEACVRSVQAQSYRRWELIVVDDGSSDSTARIVKQLCHEDDRIRLIRHQYNLGPGRLAETYNQALAESKGDLIGVLEGDDSWVPEKLAEQVPVFRDEHVVLCYGDYDEVTADGRLITRHDHRDAIAPDRSGARDNLEFFSTLRSLGSNTVLVRRRDLLLSGGFCSRGLPLVDYPTWLKLAPTGDFVRIPRVCGMWRRHSRSIYYAHEYATLQQLKDHFLRYLTEAREQLLRSGLTPHDIEHLADNAEKAFRKRQRSRPYYEGKYYLLMEQRSKAILPFGRALIAPGTSLRHRMGALVGMFAVLTSPRLVSSLSRIARSSR
jgi:glycosyltransferase involved in cell wall biosynthesis